MRRIPILSEYSKAYIPRPFQMMMVVSAHFCHSAITAATTLPNTSWYWSMRDWRHPLTYFAYCFLRAMTMNASAFFDAMVSGESRKDWKDHTESKIILIVTIFLVAWSAYINKRLERSGRVIKMSDSLFYRIELQDLCWFTLVLLIVMVILTIILVPTGSSLNAALGGLLLSFWTTWAVLKNFYLNERNMSLLLIESAIKFHCMDCVENQAAISDHWLKYKRWAEECWPYASWEEHPSTVREGQSSAINNCWSRCWRTSRCVFCKIRKSYYEFRLAWIPLCTAQPKPADPRKANKQIDALVFDELKRRGRWSTILRVVPRRRYFQLRGQRGYDYSGNAPPRVTDAGELMYAVTTVQRVMSHVHTREDSLREPHRALSLMEAKWYHLGHSGQSGPIESRGLIEFEHAPRLDTADNLGCMVSRLCETTGLVSDKEKAWWAMGPEVVASLHRSLGITKVEHPSSRDHAKLMYEIIEIFDATSIGREIQEVVAHGVVEQNRRVGIYFSEDDIKAELKQWFDGYGDFSVGAMGDSNCINFDAIKDGTKQAVQWITLGLMIQFCSHQLNQENLWRNVRTTMSDAMETAELNPITRLEPDSSPLLWFLDVNSWPYEKLEQNVAEWAISLMAAENYPELRVKCTKAFCLGDLATTDPEVGQGTSESTSQPTSTSDDMEIGHRALESTPLLGGTVATPGWSRIGNVLYGAATAIALVFTLHLWKRD